MNNLIDIEDLKGLLGYTDIRTVRKWCKKNSVPLAELGNRTYTQCQFIDRLVAAKFGNKSNSQSTTGTIIMNIDNKSAIHSKTTDRAPKRRENKRGKIALSEASTRLLKNIHSTE